MYAWKRPFAALLCLLLLGTTPAAAQTDTPPYDQQVDAEMAAYYPEDIATVPWAEDTILDLVHADIVKGYDIADGRVAVHPNATITRAEFVALLVRALHLQKAANAQSFVDVPATSWYYDVISTASSLGIVNGVSSNRFAPTKNIRRDEIAKILAVAFAQSVNFNGPSTPFQDVGTYWARPYINQVSAAGIVNGYDASGGQAFRPAKNASRAEAMTMLQRALKKQSYALPNDIALKNLVLANEDAFYNNYKANDWAKQLTAQAQYMTGEAKRRADFNVHFIQQQAARGATMQITRDTEPTAAILSKSDQFAVVQLKNANYTATLNAPNLQGEETKFDAGAILYLRKLPNGDWKIYSATPTAEEEVQGGLNAS
ncbi:MAG TPA: S-layer homology domain-containing protein [Bacilli bacterium]|nr:S-layer homology domain-containing protein [Bacilli bacterium]